MVMVEAPSKAMEHISVRWFTWQCRWTGLHL